MLGPGDANLRSHIARKEAIARTMIDLVDAGYFDRRPPAEAAPWLRRAIAELDSLQTGHDPAQAIDRLDGLLAELKEVE